MPSSLAVVFAAWSLLSTHGACRVVNQQLVGTWTSKSGKVITGPGFYNPTAETITEPKLTGISYSFTADGYYEEALFRAIPNPVDPSCPGAIIQWQHGSFVQTADTALRLTPISVDGRQLLSEPCSLGTSWLTRYHQNETFTKAEVEIDSFNGRLRLNLYGWGGTPINPMWLAYNTPEMLPTTALNPTISHTAFRAAPTSTSRHRVKRAVILDQERFQKKTLKPLMGRKITTIDRWFWMAIGSMGVGSVLYFCV